MAFLQSDYVFHDSLRPPAREAHDSQSCAITRGSVPNDMVAFRSQHSSAGPGFYEQQFATTKYPATKVKLVPREGVTPAWNEEIKNLLSQCRRSHILIEDGPPTLHRFMQEAPSIELPTITAHASYRGAGMATGEHRRVLHTSQLNLPGRSAQQSGPGYA